MKKVIYNDHFMSAFIFEHLDDGSLDICKVSDFVKHKKLPLFLKLIKFRFTPFIYIVLFFFSRCIRSVKKSDMNNVANNTVLYFSVENMFELTRLLHMNRYLERHVLWIWNPASSFGKNKYDRWLYQNFFLPSLKFVGVEVWSFDQQDVDIYKFSYHPQIHNSVRLLSSALSSVDPESLIKSRSFFFVGLDKGRLNKLMELNECLADFHVNCDFHIIADSGKNYSNKDMSLLKREYLSYSEYLKRISGYLGLIDLVQDGQSGLTLRVLEALFLKKKLITNNLMIKEYDFYSDKNIFVLEQDVNVEKLSFFLKSEFEDVNPDVLKKYDINHLLNSVFH